MKFLEVLANLKICRSIVIPGKRNPAPHGVQGEARVGIYSRRRRDSGCPGFPLKFTLAKAGAGMTVFRTFARASLFTTLVRLRWIALET